jgi:hypothetical protein
MRAAGLVLWGVAVAAGLQAYPLDGAARTGIRRLAAYRLAHEKKIASSLKIPPGGLWGEAQIALRLQGRNELFDIDGRIERDGYLQAGLERIFGPRDRSYSVALLDITDPMRPLYAALRPDEMKIPGSVGKLLVATGLFGALARHYPDTRKRETLLRETSVTADAFVYRDSHTVPIWHEGDSTILNRPIQAGDRFNLWEWLDHMLSQSSNAAGSMVWKQALLLRHFGARYPLPKPEEDAFFKATPKPELSRLALETLEAPLIAAGIDTNRLRLGTFFTRNASAVIPGTSSYAAPRELLRWLIKLEQGKVVDAWSSLEIKKLLYFARPRYRYAAAPALNHAAVFFKSGSLFECASEPGFACGAYKGNKVNLMHSVAIVESGRAVYLVAMMSNVLKVNSAVEHQTIAGEIHRLIEQRPSDRRPVVALKRQNETSENVSTRSTDSCRNAAL